MIVCHVNLRKLFQICKYFLEAVEKAKYGWFWECPNGEKCIYRHALPVGYVLKRDKKKEDKKQEISLEELIEHERAALGSVLVYLLWLFICEVTDIHNEFVLIDQSYVRNIFGLEKTENRGEETT